jgi:heme/copper-type cytochrome/quinol oxidase subunit 3
MRRTRPALDVSKLPYHVFGSQAHSYWGTIGMMLSEGMTIAISLAAYLYLRKNFDTWPPKPIENPNIIIPTIAVLFLVSTNYIGYRLDRAARARDLRGTKVWMYLLAAAGFVALVLRYFEFQSLNVRWDSNAYGSIAWGLLGFHTSLLLTDVVETMGFAGILFARRTQEKHFGHASENAMYWAFTTLSQVPVYLLVFLSPHYL